MKPEYIAERVKTIRTSFAPMKISNEEAEGLFFTFLNVMTGPDDEPFIVKPLVFVGRDKNTCLHILAWRRGKFGEELRATEMLLKGGLDVNAVGNLGDTPLHVAYKTGRDNVDLANLLLKHGASTTIKNDVGMTPDDCMKARTVKLSEDELNELQALIGDMENHDDTDTPIDPLTHVDLAHCGDTCLHRLAWSGGRYHGSKKEELRAAELLIKGGVDVNAIGDMDSTPLYFALSHFPELVPLLKKHGAVSKSFLMTPIKRTVRLRATRWFNK